MRTHDSICLLCQTGKATQRNSHILPKFLSKSVLGDANHKRGFIIDTDNADKPHKIVQDTDKEDYILCPSCEGYFSVLETYIADKFYYRIRNSLYKEEFLEYQLMGELIKKSLKINQTIFRLFIYSIIFRCNTSSGIFSLFRINPDEEKLLRDYLIEYKCNKSSELYEKVKNASTVKSIPFVIATANEFNNITDNIQGAYSGYKNPYQLFLNEYLLIFSFNENKHQLNFNDANNFDNTEVKVLFFEKQTWEKYKLLYIELAAKFAKETLIRKGTTAWSQRKRPK